MQIQQISIYNSNINFRGKNQIKNVFGMVPTGIAASLAFNKILEDEEEGQIFGKDLLYLEDIEEDIFDEEYYKAYYNIDLNLAHNRAFRDNELFNPLRDMEDNGYKKYGNDDVKCADNIIYNNDINEYTSEYKISDTDFGDMELPQVVTNPYKLNDNDLSPLVNIKINKNFEKLNKKAKELDIGEFTKALIYSDCKRNIAGYNEIDFTLADIAMDLYMNSRKEGFGWGKLEENIVSILKNNTVPQRHSILYSYITESINNGLSNIDIYEKIYEHR